MNTWTPHELARLGAAEEIEILSRRTDGTLRKPVIVWLVRDGAALYVRAVKGRQSPWFRGTQSRREGIVRLGGLEKPVRFQDAASDVHEALDAHYHAKYRRYGRTFVDSVVSSTARSATLELVPLA